MTLVWLRLSFPPCVQQYVHCSNGARMVGAATGVAVGAVAALFVAMFAFIVATVC